MYMGVQRRGKLLDLAGTKESPCFRTYAWIIPSFGTLKKKKKKDSLQPLSVTTNFALRATTSS